MTTMVIGEKAAIFNYGFLSIKTSKVLTKAEKKKATLFTDEDFKTIEKAKVFLEKIINGQMLMEGEKGSFTPSSESVEAVSYALNILSTLQDERLIEKIIELSDIKKIFQKIYDVVNNIHNKSFDKIDDNNLELSKNFFLWVSRKLVSDAQEIAQLRPQTSH